MNATLEELQARWPLFKYDERKDFHTSKPGFQIWLNPRSVTDNGNVSTYVSDVIDERQVNVLDDYHKRLRIRNAYHEKYPNLWFYIDQTTSKVTGVWVRRDGRDGEGIGVYGDALQDPVMLEHLNIEAGKALQDGWFWCSRCDEPKPDKDYGYYFFAGKYCKACQMANPKHYREAMSESYN